MKKSKWMLGAAAMLALSVALLAAAAVTKRLITRLAVLKVI